MVESQKVREKAKELARRMMGAAALVGVVATAAACGEMTRTSGATPSSERAAAIAACTPVIKKGEKPEKINFPADFYYGADVSEGQGQLGVETAVQSYRNLNEVANVIIDIPLDSKGIGGDHFKTWPLDNAPAWEIDVSDFKFQAGQDSTPTDQLVYEIDYPGCANVNGEDWIYIDKHRVFPEYAQSSISPRTQTAENWQATWSNGAWIKVSDVSNIPGVKIYHFKTSTGGPIIKGRYNIERGPNDYRKIGDLHFPGIADNAYITLNAVDKGSANTMYKSGVQIADLGKYLAGH